MAKDDKEIMSALRQALVGRVGLDVYDLWFGRVVLQPCDAGLEVGAPDPFTLERLRSKLRGEIEAACATVWGRQVEVRFVQSSVGPRAESASVDGSAAVSGPSPLVRSSSPSPPLLPAPRASSGRADGNVKHAEESMRSSLVPAVRPLLAVRDHGESSAREVTERAPGSRDVVEQAPRRRGGTFETFAAGPANQLALTAARSVVPRLGVASPILLYGPNGCGKTHLLEGIVTEARRSGRVRRALLLSAEQFTSQFLEALQGSGLPNFRRKYRDLDLLAIDDVHFLVGKKATLVEFHHTLDGLQRSGRQVVLSADRAPGELQALGADVVMRISGGLVCGMEEADESIRRGIVVQAARRLELELSEPVIEFVASSFVGDARQLLGAVNRLDALSRATGEPVSLGAAQQALTDLVRGGQRMVRLPDIERAVCQVFGIDVRTLQSNSKSRGVSQPRMLAMWLARKYTRAGLSEIGEFFGRRSHTTVIAAQRKMDDWMNRRESIRIDAGECTVVDAVRRVEHRLRTG